MQNTTKWKEWPNKLHAKKKLKHFKRRQKRKKKKTEEDAKKALESGSVIILIAKVIPKGAIALLGKGLNFTPTPTENTIEEQLDMRLNTNRIIQAAKSDVNTLDIKSSIPSKLSHKRYAAQKPCEEAAVNNVVNNMAEEHNGRLQFDTAYYANRKKNTTKEEE